MKISFTEHPASVGETYFGHMFSALGFCGKMTLALMCCLTHAFLPFLFEKTGSQMVCNLVDDMVHNRDKRDEEAKQLTAE
ncbi:DUF6356 family protein [Emcibacteraceae bacterium]|jgi:hypothetical protein|uniref:DUF6356 family protein n=1 Tax=Pseudemcibacter sp. TaxID=2943293 RepID=UPI0023281EF6|nr:hypothetical protein [Kordiimonadaceae bacterium]MDA7568800.1 DUF6356 family protein [Emcibacteraceae bacterium]MDA9553328.1 DUF6356 family protein [Emcibacteraceae bacterium]MDA9770237.1 DUF6356 family protein [Emcibacteraceae bacterium]MDG1021890.1 DUF6356 family protein [Emcibacteraceae bacterium]